MAFDYKKEYKEFYLPKLQPSFVTIPTMKYVAFRGQGDPNQINGEYMLAMQVIYGIAYTIKMSKMGDHRIDGYFDYVVPPLEGFWWQVVDGKPVVGFDHDKSLLHWVSLIRLPEFVTLDDFEWARSSCASKKKVDCSKAEFLTIEEGLCAQIMHMGPYDEEPETLAQLEKFVSENGYQFHVDLVNHFHHEIYLSDPRKTHPSKCKTVLRYSVKKSPEAQ